MDLLQLAKAEATVFPNWMDLFSPTVPSHSHIQIWLFHEILGFMLWRPIGRDRCWCHTWHWGKAANR